MLFKKIYDLPGAHTRNCGSAAGGALRSMIFETSVIKNKHKKGIKTKMRHNTYTAQRREMSWSRNRNTVRHTGKTLGSMSLFSIFGLLILIVGLIYVTQGTRATAYDYELSKIETEIDELQAQKDDLAIEKARLTSIASAESSTVAAAMEDANVGGYAE